jgi:hypothetical protein
LPSLARYTPAGLFTAASDLAMGRELSLLWVTLGISALCIVVALWVADRLFAQQELA